VANFLIKHYYNPKLSIRALYKFVVAIIRTSHINKEVAQ